MNDRTGQTWRLTNLDGQGFVFFTVLRSERAGTTEIVHEILVLEAKDFEIFKFDHGHSSFWWESQIMVWETDSLYERIA